MPKRSESQPTELELQILHVLWDQSPLPVREVRRRLEDEGRPLAHTSVITVLNLMVEKGFLARTPLKNAFLYEPRISRDKVSQQMTQGLVDRVFRGSHLAVVEQLLEFSDLDGSEIAEIRKLVNRKLRAQS